MRIAMCIADKCEETSTHASQLCPKCLAEHKRRCAKAGEKREAKGE